MTSSETSSPQRSSLHLVVLLLITVFALSPVCRNEFIEWDDPQTIASNPNLNPPTLRGLLHHWTSPHEALYIPVTYTAWWLTAQIAQTSSAEGPSLNPWIFHSVNLLIHLFASLMVYGLLRQLISSPLAAFLGAMIFAVHPVQVESVAWASGTKDVLCGALSLTAMRLEIASKNRAGRIAAIIVFLLAFLAKPSAVVVPVLLLLIHWLWLGQSFKLVIRRLAIWLVAIIPMIVLTAMVQPTIHSQTAPLWSRPLVAGDALAFYLYKLILPINLAIDYGRTPARIMETGQIWWTWIVPVMVILFMLRWRRKGIAIFLLFIVALGPVLGLVNFTFQSYSTVADHYLYLPMFAVSLLVASAVRAAPIKLLTAAVPVILILATLSFLQATTWRDTRSAFTQVLRVNDRSALAFTNLAVVAIREHDDAAAKPLLERAITANPDYGPARLNLAMLHLRAGDKHSARLQFEALLGIYESQRNADPRVVEQVRQAIEKLTQ